MILDLNMKPGLPPVDLEGEVLIKHRDYGWMIGCRFNDCWGGSGFNRKIDMIQGVLFLDEQVDNAIGWVSIHSDN